MMDIYFFLKTLILTLALIIVLQLKVGEHTLEDRAVSVFKSSIVEEPLTKIAQGGALLVRRAVFLIQEKINGGEEKKESETSPKKKSGFKFIWDSQ